MVIANGVSYEAADFENGGHVETVTAGTGTQTARFIAAIEDCIADAHRVRSTTSATSKDAGLTGSQSWVLPEDLSASRRGLVQLEPCSETVQNIALEEGASARGQVVDELGAPVFDAAVEGCLEGRWMDFRGTAVRSTRSARGGSFELRGLPASGGFLRARKAGLAVNADGHERSAFELLSYPNMEAEDLVPLWPEIAELSPAILDQLTVDAQYAVYLERQEADIAAVKRDESREIPDWLDYAALPGLSMELRQKLGQRRPATIAQAQAIDGVTPAAITLILSVIRRGSLRQAS